MRFNYHEQDRDSFLSWTVIHLITEVMKDDDQFEKLNKLTKKWTEIDLTIQINGVEVSPKHFLEGIKSNMDFWAEQKAEAKAHEILDNVREKVDTVEELLEDIAEELKRKINTMLKD